MEEMMLKAIIFDLDGVIVSTDNYHYRAWKMMADKEGIYFDREINNRLRGVSRLESLEIILECSPKNYSESEKQNLMEYKNQVYLNLLDELSEKDILPGILDLLNFLKEKKYLMAIGSSSKNAKKILKQIGLLNSFDAIVDGNDIDRSKPAPDVFLIAANKMNIEPSKCAVIEDAFAGIKAAKAAGMLAIAIHNAVKYQDADLFIEEPNDLIQYFNK
jgi:beta-phosphoglucomutase